MPQAKVGAMVDTVKARKDLDKELKSLEKTRRMLNYLSAAQIYLKDNMLMKEKIKKEHLKERLLGHWGTCPGLNLVYGHCNLLIKRFDLNMFLVVGPGHGAPAILANLFLEGSLGRFYPDYCNTSDGIKTLIKGFSWPGGFPSHINSQLPGCIHEGGELGYSLAVSFGAVMDQPDLIVTCIVGDGEAETGPTAGAWHSIKYLDPKESGAVIPILHDNGYKITSPTIFGSMSDEELVSLFTGYGYAVRIVEDMDDIDADMAASMEWALNEIRSIQKAARSGQPIFKPKWPMIVMRTPKGWTGIKMLHGKKIEGNYLSHDIPAKDPFKDEEQFTAVCNWLTSYNIAELLDEKDAVKQELIDTYPQGESKMGQNPRTYPKNKPLDLPSIADFEVKFEKNKSGDTLVSPTESGGSYLAAVIKKNPQTFRIFSPDELESNKLEGVFKETYRNFQWNQDMANRGGRVTEVLSEHNCQGWMQGYTLTGRYALFPSYETFLGIITTMMIQYAKFIKLASETNWRNEQPSLNYIQTSTLWRQEHNGYSHQDPMFSNNMVNMKHKFIRVYYPPDANTFLWTLNDCLASLNRVNLLVGTKKEMPTFLNAKHAKKHCEAGAGIWRWLSTDEGRDPDVVIVGCGNETNFEAVAAATLLRKDAPNLRVRFVNVVDIMVLSSEEGIHNALSLAGFHAIFTKDKPVIFNFHGYPSLIHQLLFGKNHDNRVHVLGYIEEGTTTTPFDMMVRNKTSRYDIMIMALEKVMESHPSVQLNATTLIAKYKNEMKRHGEYIRKWGKDPKHLSTGKVSEIVDENFDE